MNAEDLLTSGQTERAPRERSLAPARSRKLVFAQVAWVVIAVVELGLFSASVPARWHQLNNPSPGLASALADLKMSPGFFAGYNVGLEALFALSFALVALIILWRKFDDLTAVIISMMLLCFGSSAAPVMQTTNALSDLYPEWMPLVRLMNLLTWVLVFYFFCVFPDGKFTPRWSRYFFLYATLISIPWDLWPDTVVSPWTWSPPLLLAVDLSLWGTCIFIQIHRYRNVSNRVQKQQTKWVVFGLFVSMVGILGFFLPRMIFPALANPETPETVWLFLLSSTIIVLAALVTPVAIAISIMRYRLWDIDLLINRTLVYVPLTAILAGLYTASIPLFQRLFIAFTGNKSDVAIIMSTLLLASMFTPIKNSLQTVVDRRFKENTDPHVKLKAFRSQVESVVQVLSYRRMAEKLVAEATAAFGAKGGAVYLGEKGHMHLVYNSEDWDGEAKISVPLYADDVRLGMVSLGVRHNGLPYTNVDRQTLREVVDVVAEAVALEAQVA